MPKTDRGQNKLDSTEGWEITMGLHGRQREEKIRAPFVYNVNLKMLLVLETAEQKQHEAVC